MCHGGTLANLVALLAARRWKAGKEDDPWESGDDEKGAVLVSEQAHYCVDRAVRIMGWGAGGVGLVSTDEQHRITEAGLEAAWDRLQSQGRRVVAVVASACTTSTGAYDNIEMLADFAERHCLWLHVDGAHGAAAAFSAKHRSWISGMERAHSVAMIFIRLWGFPLCVRAYSTARRTIAFFRLPKRRSICGATPKTRSGGTLESAHSNAPSECSQPEWLRSWKNMALKFGDTWWTGCLAWDKRWPMR